MVAVVFAATAVVETVNVPEVAPAAIVTEPGTVAEVELLPPIPNPGKIFCP